MALAANTWFEIEFLPYSDVAWTGITPSAAFPQVPGPAGFAVINAPMTLHLFCTSLGATDVTFAAKDIPSFTVPIATIDTENALTTLETTYDDGGKWYAARAVPGVPLLLFDDRSGEFRAISDAPTLAALAALLA